ncbi:pilus assembly protein [Paenibacillus oenotherae]|uniref:Pilus assembly protein n=1 Tax=Paenibacillus oenotherae TaxID=1435645 RepID=A0ABS7D9K6_9BACL|nr:pilus assembly protein [Paenibacillus oenotherae]MBW7476550.1 pilus assembly protein [Paenibacillus oenotherae]
MTKLRFKLKDEEGSLSIESSMVLPTVFLSLIIMLLFSMYVYQNVVLYYMASISAERAAFRWDNSKRDMTSGMGLTGQYDGLYWRMASDGALQSLFGIGSGNGNEGGGTVISVGGTGNGNADHDDEPYGESLPGMKLGKVAGRMPESIEGQMKYKYGWTEKRIQARLQKPMSVPLLEFILGHAQPSTVSSAAVVDPVEFIRNVELVRYYTAKFGQGAGASPKRAQAAQLLMERSNQ